VLLADLVAASAAVAATRSRRQKVASLAACLRAMAPTEVEIGAGYLAGSPRQPRLDIGWAGVRAVDPPAAAAATLTLTDVHTALEGLVGRSGPGSRAARMAALAALLARATAEEQRWLRGLVLGDLRQGALEGVVVQAVAAAFDLDEAAVRRAVMLRGDVGAVAAAAATGGAEALAAFRLELFRPIQPMLAQTAGSLAEAVTALAPAVVETKLDGARVQVHRRGGEVKVFSRNLRDVTARSPEVVAAALALPAASAVLDGEVIALRPDGRPRAFQDTMRTFGTGRGAPASEPRAASTELTVFFFDLLHLDGRDLLDAPLAARSEALAGLVGEDGRVPRAEVDDVAAAEVVLAAALDAGHEGVMVKSLAAPYEAGRRGAGWQKVKPVHTLDLVVLAAEWGSGRRQGWLSNLHLGARGPDGGFVMLGKTFKGLTDELLAWQTEALLARETGREGHVVHVRPELVVEIAVDGVQRSTRYPGGVALRFARVKGYRPDKDAADADMLVTVLALLP
jgi:DNA ligase 1